MNNKGFTLLELLIVIAIIGILTAVTVTSVTVSRGKARDTRRVGDMKEIQIGLALYYDVNKAYPQSLYTLVDPAQHYLPELPTDPQTGAMYEYTASSTTSYKNYCIGVTLEYDIPNDSVSCVSTTTSSTANYKAQR